ncbi:DnaJ family domain-containing protein [Sutcliffiella horikoshii]|uniref:DnaJ family domain-containing protein n=1 Tax=Sutcliffiella horikoshii TaxID=79883 RepID=UPI0021CC9CA5|nr:DnaJ family domain-containing protein [Sutcliffiella horikoshii]
MFRKNTHSFGWKWGKLVVMKWKRVSAVDFFRLTDEKIKKAYEDGEFENLPGYGKRLELEDLSNVPPEMRMAYKMMKNAGMMEEQQVRTEIEYLEDLIDGANSEAEEARLNQRLTEKQLRLQQLIQKKKKEANSAVFKDYQSQIMRKFD